MKNNTIDKLLINSVLPYVEKPARYLGNEHNVIHKSLSEINLRFAIAFPEVYEIAMSSQAINILYHQLNCLEGVWAERVFAPWIDAEKKLREHRIPLHSLESFTPLNEFDIIGFTLQYELTYTNILNMLDLAGIPLLSEDRLEDAPIIIGGGPCSCNPEPIAPFFDAFYIGDAESGIADLCKIIIDSKKKCLSRRVILKRLSTLRGIYIPSFYKADYDPKGHFTGLTTVDSQYPSKIKTQIIPRITNNTYPDKPLVPLIGITHDRLAIEVMRGCSEGCRYCNAGMIYRPVRERSVDDIVSYTKKAFKETGFEEISFLSLSISDYSALKLLMKKELDLMSGEQINFSFPSMRLDSFNEEMAAFAGTVRKSGFTFAPEAGNDRLRKVINKNISDNDLLKATRITLENGWKTLKFYFMIGLPTETKEDVEAIADLIERVILETKKFGKIQLNISVSPHSPKSHTPFQWEKQDTKEEFLKKINLLKARTRKYKQVKLSWRDPEVSQIECILGRGDRRLADVIKTVWVKGARFDGWNEHFSYQGWMNAFIECGLDMKYYLKQFPLEAALPWDHIDKGVTKSFLKKERQKAYKEVQTEDCREGSCVVCGFQRKNGFKELSQCYMKTEKPSKQLSIQAGKSANPVDNSIQTLERDGQQRTVYHYRIHFTKNGYSKYLGHFDVVRAFERAFRRARIEVAHSQGFNPRPKLSFGPPLKLGYSSEAEFVDIQVFEKSANHIKNNLNSHLPAGIQVQHIISVKSSIPSLMASINAMEYQINVDNQKFPGSKIEQVLSDSEIFVSRIVKGQLKTINIRPFIKSIEQNDHIMTVHTNIIEGRAARMDEIISQLYVDHSITPVSFPIHRKRQLITKNGFVFTPMEIG